MLRLSPRQIRSLTSGLVLKNSAAPTAGPQNQNDLAIPKNIKPVIGLEVHAQLNTKSKLFSQGANNREASPNSQLDLLDVAIPGSLPKLNFSALRAAIITALGLNCSIQDVIHFDRKNYFYTDMPAGYQITQYNRPIASNGYIDFIVTAYDSIFLTDFIHSQHYDMVKYVYYDDWKLKDEFKAYVHRSHIKQLQLEQDSAKTLYQTTGDQEELNNLVDYNRSGAGLLEIVFEPDLTKPDEASSLVRELIMILKSLKTCDCELQEGSLRVDANVSIESIDGQKVPKTESNRVELKNLNSLRSLNRGIAYEIQRQARELVSGNKIIQESRTFDTKTGTTNVLRAKETAVDYRYVPEPSIPPLVIDKILVEQAKQDLERDVVLPSKIRQQLAERYCLDLALIVELLDEPGLARYFMSIMDHEQAKIFDSNSVADFLIYSIAKLKNIRNLPFKVALEDEHGDFLRKLSPDKMVKLLGMVFDDKISFYIAYETMKCMFTGAFEDCPQKLIEQFEWFQLNDESEIDKLCADLIKGMKSVSKRYRNRGEKKDMRYMLDKLNQLHDNRVNVRIAMKCINRRLRPVEPEE
jgi:aspartyl-tRNA(Asn)/glutamyl-tRNA(Gln) amidotransferase subunit B